MAKVTPCCETFTAVVVFNYIITLTIYQTWCFEQQTIGTAPFLDQHNYIDSHVWCGSRRLFNNIGSIKSKNKTFYDFLDSHHGSKTMNLEHTCGYGGWSTWDPRWLSEWRSFISIYHSIKMIIKWQGGSI